MASSMFHTNVVRRLVFLFALLAVVGECGPTKKGKATLLEATYHVASEQRSRNHSRLPGSDATGVPDSSKALDPYKKNDPDMVWFWGVAMTLVGQTICVLGLQVQKFSHMVHTPEAAGKQPSKSVEDGLLGAVSKRALPSGNVDLVDEESHYFVHWRWLVGGVICAIGHLMCWAAMGLAPLSILSCLQSWNVIVALGLAKVLLNETLAPYALQYACLLVVGCIVVVVFGPQSDHYEFETADTLREAFVAPASIVVHVVCLGLLVLSMTTTLLKTEIFKVEKYLLMSATCAWYAALCSKSMSMMVITSVAGHNMQVHHWRFWHHYGTSLGYILVFAFFAVGQIHFMNLGLKFGLASRVMPFYEGASMIGQLFFGGILFGEFKNFHNRGAIGFSAGVIIVVISLGLLIKANADFHPNDNDVVELPDQGSQETKELENDQSNIQSEPEPEVAC